MNEGNNKIWMKEITTMNERNNNYKAGLDD